MFYVWTIRYISVFDFNTMLYVIYIAILFNDYLFTFYKNILIALFDEVFKVDILSMMYYLKLKRS